MKTLFPISALVLLLMSGCFPFDDVDCDNARTCVINQTGDTVNYCWGCNNPQTYPDGIMLPGDTACQNVGQVSVTRNGSNAPIVSFHAAGQGAIYSWKVDDCYVEKVIE